MLNKKKKSKRNFIIILFILLLALTYICTEIYINYDNTTIIAKKTETIERQNRKIKYKIKINNKEFISAKKEIIFDTKEEAKSEYEKYKVIMRNENREKEVELKNKKIILRLSKVQFAKDIGYEKNTIIIMEEDERK